MFMAPCSSRSRSSVWGSASQSTSGRHSVAVHTLLQTKVSPVTTFFVNVLVEATETPVMGAGWVKHHQAVGNGGSPAPHHPISGNMWTGGLSWSTAEEEEEYRWLNTCSYVTPGVRDITTWPGVSLLILAKRATFILVRLYLTLSQQIFACCWNVKLLRNNISSWDSPLYP